MSPAQGPDERPRFTEGGAGRTQCETQNLCLIAALSPAEPPDAALGTVRDAEVGPRRRLCGQARGWAFAAGPCPPRVCLVPTPGSPRKRPVPCPSPRLSGSEQCGRGSGRGLWRARPSPRSSSRMGVDVSPARTAGTPDEVCRATPRSGVTEVPKTGGSRLERVSEPSPEVQNLRSGQTLKKSRTDELQLQGTLPEPSLSLEWA